MGGRLEGGELMGLYECGWDVTVSELNPLTNFFLIFIVLPLLFFCRNFLFPTWTLWTNIRHDQSGVNTGLREDTQRNFDNVFV